MTTADRPVTLLAASVLASLGLLPIANWIPGGPAIPAWGDLVSGWWSGTAIVAGAALAAAILLRGRLPAFPALPSLWVSRPAAVTLGLGLAAGLAYAGAAVGVFSGRPLLIDEIAQVYQARTFADGSLTRAAGSHPEFFASNLLVEHGGRIFAQFPAGGPAMLALGTLLGAEWLVGPLFGTLSVVLFIGILRRVEPRAGVALGTAMVFALAPLTVFMSGSHMNHVTALTWLLVGCTGLIRLTDTDEPTLRWAVVAGLGFGVAATIRPLDAAAFAVPAGVWLASRAVRRGAWAPMVTAGLVIAAVLSIQLVINARTTGSPWLFGYNLNYGAGQGLGFHRTPWGEVHTPARGLELLNLYFVRLQTYFLELPVPGLLAATVALALARALSGFDRYLLAASGLLAGLYFAYWHDGFYLGPRFFYPLLPFLALWSARAFALIQDRADPERARPALAAAAIVAVAMGVATQLPTRIAEHRTRFSTMRWDANRAAEAAGVRNAIVLVRESWGAQLLARLSAAGVGGGRMEQLYRWIDACALEQALDKIEARKLRGPAADAVLQLLLADSGRVVPSPFTVDKTNRYLPGTPYTAECRRRLADDQRGFTLFPPLVLAGGGDVIYGRDLHGRDSLLLAAYPDRSVYLLRPSSAELGAAPRFERLRRDSLLTAWRHAR